MKRFFLLESRIFFTSKLDSILTKTKDPVHQLNYSFRFKKLENVFSNCVLS